MLLTAELSSGVRVEVVWALTFASNTDGIRIEADVISRACRTHCQLWHCQQYNTVLWNLLICILALMLVSPWISVHPCVCLSLYVSTCLYISLCIESPVSLKLRYINLQLLSKCHYQYVCLNVWAIKLTADASFVEVAISARADASRALGLLIKARRCVGAWTENSPQGHVLYCQQKQKLKELINVTMQFIIIRE